MLKRVYAGVLLTDLSKAKLHAYGFSLESLTFIQSYLSYQIPGAKTNSFFNDYSNVESGVPQGSICEPLFLNILICDLFFDDIDIDPANYANDTSPYAYDLENEKVIKLLEKNIDQVFAWFSDNFFKS